MISKNSVFLGVAAALSASAIAVLPAQAESAKNETLVAQLRGYEVYSPIEMFQQDWLQWQFTDNIAVGRVVAKVGDICFVHFLSPDGVSMREKLACDWKISAGSDVIAGYDDDGWTIISEDDLPIVYTSAFPSWVTRLELKEEVEVQRTSIDWGESRQVELPPLRPQAEAPAPVYTEPTPIRGLW